jgi:hypothetical protein
MPHRTDESNIVQRWYNVAINNTSTYLNFSSLFLHGISGFYVLFYIQNIGKRLGNDSVLRGVCALTPHVPLICVCEVGLTET